MKDNAFTNVAQSVSLIDNNYYETDKYRALVEKLVQLGSNNWTKFQEKVIKNYTQLKRNKKNPQ